MIISLLIYIVIILPIAISNYKKDGKRQLFRKILNIIITLFVFVFYGGNTKLVAQQLFEKNFDLISGAPVIINVLIAILIGVLSFYTIILVFRLATRNEKGRKPFLIMCPILFVMTGFLEYQEFINTDNEIPTIVFIAVSNTTNLLIWISIFFFYKSKKTKAFLALNEEN